MLGRYLSPLALGFGMFRLALALLALGVGARLWRRPSPAGALGLVLAVNLLGWAATEAPLRRPYALGEGSDRTFNIGMAARVALGGSPFEHTQVRFPSPEPFWNAVAGLLALSRPEWAGAAYGLLSPLSMVAVALGLYFGLRGRPGEADAWERVLLVAAVFGLSSISMNPRPPVPLFWMGNFLLKPDHAAALGLVGVILGARAREPARPLLLGALLGLLAWVFLMHWGYVVAGLLAGTALRPRAERDWKRLLLAVGLSGLLALPYVVHLARGYSPFATHRAAIHMWQDDLGLPLAVPYWLTLDLGLLLVLGLAGIWVWKRRAEPRDRVFLGVAIATWAMCLVSMPAAVLNMAPEPDDLHYFLRFAMALAAGTALAAGARQIEAARGLRSGQGHLLVLGACIPFSFPFYWDPLTMDRYYAESLEPVRPKVVAYTEWVRKNTPPHAVFLAGKSSSMWIPALTGRRVLLAERGALLPPDYAARKQAERILLTSVDAEEIRATARAFGVTHLAIDGPLLEEYGVKTYYELAGSPVYRTLFANSAARIVDITPEGGAEGRPRSP